VNPARIAAVPNKRFLTPTPNEADGHDDGVVFGVGQQMSQGTANGGKMFGDGRTRRCLWRSTTTDTHRRAARWSVSLMLRLSADGWSLYSAGPHTDCVTVRSMVNIARLTIWSIYCSRGGGEGRADLLIVAPFIGAA